MRKRTLRLVLMLAAAIGLLSALALIGKDAPFLPARSHSSICRAGDAGPNRQERQGVLHEEPRPKDVDVPSSVRAPIPANHEDDAAVVFDIRQQLGRIEDLVLQNRRRPGLSANETRESELQLVVLLTQSALASPGIACPEIWRAIGDQKADPLFRAYLALVLGMSDISGQERKQLREWWKDSSGIIAESALIGSFLKSLERDDLKGIQAAWERISYSGILSRELSYAACCDVCGLNGGFDESGFRETYVRIPSAEETRAVIELCQDTYASNPGLADNAVRLVLPPGDPLVADLCEHLWYVGNPSLRHLALQSLTRNETPELRVRLERMKRMTPRDREEDLMALDQVTR